ncbi:MAG: hypothetical protein AAB428_01715 [Patescibacteria group bacterium]
MDNFLKFYWLEQKYLKEVRASFQKNGYLTTEQFFAVVKWKRAGNAELIKRIFLKDKLNQVNENNWLEKKVRNITNDVKRATENQARLEVLIKQPGIKLAMASAILTILYPNNFTVYDWRVRGQLKEHRNNKGKEYPDITYSSNVIQRYFDEYIPQVTELGRKIAQNNKLSLRNCDRLLWAKSWYEDLQKFIGTKKT